MEYNHRPLDIEGKTAVVIGGTSGIGEAISLGLAHEKANVIATSRTEKKLKIPRKKSTIKE